MIGYYSRTELQKLGLKTYGNNVLISKKISIYNAHQISIGDNVRIDDFVILSGKITIGSHVHIASSCSVSGGDNGVTISDFCGLSSHVRIFGNSDDYSGETLTNPCIPSNFKKVTSKKIILEKHCIIGSGSMILPNAYLAEGVAVGAMSLVTKKTLPWGIYFGIPAKRIKDRKKKLLDLEEEYLKYHHGSLGGGGNKVLKISPLIHKEISA